MNRYMFMQNRNMGSHSMRSTSTSTHIRRTYIKLWVIVHSSSNIRTKHQVNSLSQLLCMPPRFTYSSRLCYPHLPSSQSVNHAQWGPACLQTTVATSRLWAPFLRTSVLAEKITSVAIGMNPTDAALRVKVGRMPFSDIYERH
jgi:hypothetical protein